VDIGDNDASLFWDKTPAQYRGSYCGGSIKWNGGSSTTIALVSPKEAAFKGNKSKSIMELYKIKVINCVGERKAHHEHNERN
jgi:hypothetical protein